MRKVLYPFISVVLLFLIAAAINIHVSHLPSHPVSLQQRASHMIVFLDDHDQELGLCSATAIGPHAILTAQHCNDEEPGSDTITIDLATQHFHLLAETEDGNDHVIYLLDGPAFKNFLPVEDLLNVPSPSAGDHVVLFGDGLGQYPPLRKDGFVDGASNTADLSDIDHAVDTEWYRLSVLPGDSGSAIYDDHGRVVGLLTYGFDAAARRQPSVRAVGFALGFSERVLRAANTFSIDDVEKKLGVK